VLFGGQLGHGVVFAALTRKTSRDVAAHLQMIPHSIVRPKAVPPEGAIASLFLKD